MVYSSLFCPTSFRLLIHNVRRTRSGLSRYISIVVILCAGFDLRTSHAAVITVDGFTDMFFLSNLAGNGTCELREAIEAAEQDIAIDACTLGQGVDIIQFAMIQDKEIILNGPLRLGSSFVIEGPVQHRLTLSQELSGRIISNCSGDLDNAVTLRNLTLREGRAQFLDSNGGAVRNCRHMTMENVTLIHNNTDHFGGAIANIGSLFMVDSEIANNTAVEFGGVGFGGGVACYAGYCEFMRVVFSNNGAGGGASQLDISGGASVVLRNSFLVFGGNSRDAPQASSIRIAGQGTSLLIETSTVTNNGNGILVRGTSSETNRPTLTIRYSTISHNELGIVTEGQAQVVIEGTILSNDESDIDGDGVAQVDAHYSLIEQVPMVPFTDDHSILGLDPLLGTLEYPNGPLGFRQIANDSPAVNQIPVGVHGCGTSVARDQRGKLRPRDGACDIGAIEVHPGLLFENGFE